MHIAMASNDVAEMAWAAFDGLSDLVVLLDAQGHIVHSNPAWQRFLGSASHEDIWPWIYPEDQKVLQRLLRSHHAHTTYLRVTRPAQRLAWLDTSIQWLQQAEAAYCCLIARDVTAHLHMQQRQQAERRGLEDALQRLPVMLYRSRNDWHWTMEYVSDGCLTLTGYQRSELLNTPLYGQLIHPDDQHYVWEEIQRALAHHTTFYLSYRLMQRNSTTLVVQEVGQGVYSESGMVLAVEGMVMPTQHLFPIR